MAETMKDLVALAADGSMEKVLQGIFSRPGSLKIRPFSCDIFVHPQRDPGCLTRGHDFLKPFRKSHRHALVVFDYEGCGRESATPGELEAEVTARLAATGWESRAEVVVIAPELEIWVWSESPHVDEALGWKARPPGLRPWLKEKGFLAAGHGKPAQPKEAVEKALRTASKPRSSAIYQKLAETVTLSACTDPSFQKLRSVLVSWFGE
jgi:hypothetical protein